jgi:pantoate--beta-alanine ligase
MIIFKKEVDIHAFLLNKKQEKQTIGFVPTMGALHDGHISLIQKSKSFNNLTVCSIFVNPTQFNNIQDFEKYPITIDEDILMLEEAGCDVLFLPSTHEIYSDGFVKINYDLGYLETILEGKYRPGHFQGVCMVVERLLQIISCNMLLLGQKDYQQCMVIDKMLSLRNINVKLNIAETIREANGLAMSSRNRRLSPEATTQSAVIFKTLIEIKDKIGKIPFYSIIADSKNNLEELGFDVDYVELTDYLLHPIENNTSNNGIVALIAATINSIRLIDNMIVVEKNR